MKVYRTVEINKSGEIKFFIQEKTLFKWADMEINISPSPGITDIFEKKIFNSEDEAENWLRKYVPKPFMIQLGFKLFLD